MAYLDVVITQYLNYYQMTLEYRFPSTQDYNNLYEICLMVSVHLVVNVIRFIVILLELILLGLYVPNALSPDLNDVLARTPAGKSLKKYNRF